MFRRRSHRHPWRTRSSAIAYDRQIQVIEDLVSTPDDGESVYVYVEKVCITTCVNWSSRRRRRASSLAGNKVIRCATHQSPCHLVIYSPSPQKRYPTPGSVTM
jgi:hypothetical protein